MTETCWPGGISLSLLDRQAAASEAGRTHIQHSHNQHSESSILTAAFSPHCYSLSKQMTALLNTPLSNSWSLQMTVKSEDTPMIAVIGLVQDRD